MFDLQRHLLMECKIVSMFWAYSITFSLQCLLNFWLMSLIFRQQSLTLSCICMGCIYMREENSSGCSFYFLTKVLEQTKVSNLFRLDGDLLVASLIHQSRINESMGNCLLSPKINTRSYQFYYSSPVNLVEFSLEL